MHLDAGSPATARENALQALRRATDEAPVGVINVGIFGEGIDTPSLDGIAFLEARKSPIDVIQAVGRAMRLSPDKEHGYILVPIEIPDGRDPEAWLESRENDDGYKELGQILAALRAHDGRIEDRLGDMLQIRVPADDGEPHDNLVTLLEPNGCKHAVVKCPYGQVEHALASRSPGKTALELLEENGTVEIVKDATRLKVPPAAAYVVDARRRSTIKFSPINVDKHFVPKRHGDDDKQRLTHEFDLKAATAEMEERLTEAVNKPDDDRVNKGRRPKVRLRRPRRGTRRKSPTPNGSRQLTLLSEVGERGDHLRVRLLENSGLLGGTRRDLNILREIVEGAAGKLKAESLEEELARVLGMDKYGNPRHGTHRADACTVAALVLTTATLVQARLEKTKAVKLKTEHSVASIARSGKAATTLLFAFQEILRAGLPPHLRDHREHPGPRGLRDSEDGKPRRRRARHRRAGSRGRGQLRRNGRRLRRRTVQRSNGRSGV